VSSGVHCVGGAIRIRTGVQRVAVVCLYSRPTRHVRSGSANADPETRRDSSGDRAGTRALSALPPRIFAITPQSDRGAASFHHKLTKCHGQLSTLEAFAREFQVQEQVPGDNECKQQRPDCHDGFLLAVNVSVVCLRIAMLVIFACRKVPILR
jgi:hypothetical protein